MAPRSKVDSLTTTSSQKPRAHDTPRYLLALFSRTQESSPFTQPITDLPSTSCNAAQAAPSLVPNLQGQPAVLGHPPSLGLPGCADPLEEGLSPAGALVATVSSASRGQTIVKTGDYGLQHGLRPKH